MAQLDGFVVLSSWFFVIFSLPNVMVQIGRCVRVARIALLVKRFPGLQQIFKLFFVSIPAACNIVGLLCLIQFIYACLGMYLFGHTKVLPGFDLAPDGRGVRTFCAVTDGYNETGSDYDEYTCGFGNYDNRGNFHNFFNSVKLLFQLCTGEDFLLIMPELGMSL